VCRSHYRYLHSLEIVLVRLVSEKLSSLSQSKPHLYLTTVFRVSSCLFLSLTVDFDIKGICLKNKDRLAHHSVSNVTLGDPGIINFDRYPPTHCFLCFSSPFPFYD
jgi:hypothetical protein